MALGWPPPLSGSTFVKDRAAWRRCWPRIPVSGPEPNSSPKAVSKNTRWCHLQPVKKMAGAAWGGTITRRPRHSCPVWWGPLNELSPPWTETWLSHTFSTDRPQLQVKRYLPAFTPPQNRRNANYLLPQRTRQDNGYVFSRAKGETMKRLVIWKSIHSPWVTTILYTISRDSPTLLLNLLSLQALKNKVADFSQLRKPYPKNAE